MGCILSLIKNKYRLHGLATCVSCNTWKHKTKSPKLISFTHISSTNPFWWNKHIDTVCSHKRTDAKGATKTAGLYLCVFYFSQRWAFYHVWTDKRDAFSFSSTSLFQFIQRKEISIHLSAPEHGRLTALLCFAFFSTKPIAGLEVWTAELEIWIWKKILPSKPHSSQHRVIFLSLHFQIHASYAIFPHGVAEGNRICAHQSLMAG